MFKLNWMIFYSVENILSKIIKWWWAHIAKRKDFFINKHG
jgi:hypothetical protein